MRRVFLILAIALLFTPLLAAAQSLDSDGDGVNDDLELNIYQTDPFNPDTDGDGYDDWLELNNGFSPHKNTRTKLEANDKDGDGLSDRMELNFKTNLKNSDSDGDGYQDGEEISAGFNPLDPSPDARLSKRIEINLKKQELSYWLGSVRLGKFFVSSGKNNSTKTGKFAIANKSLKAWSPYGLWMPYWLGIKGTEFGIHELPIWPNGYREGESHLGTPVSHGCVRLGIGPAKLIYDWAKVGTPVTIY